MKRLVNWRKKQVEYLISESELKEKLGIPEPLQGGVYWSAAHKTLKLFCVIPEEEKGT